MSNQRILLHLGTYEDEPYQHQLAGLSAGEQVAWKSRLQTPGTIAEIEIACAKAGVSGIVCSNQEFLEKLLHAQPDFEAPNNRRGLTLDDYQGSLLFTPRDKLPVVVINPLANLVTQSYAKFVGRRFVQKLTRPDAWFQQTKFTWELADPTTIESIFDSWQKNAALISIDIETPITNPLRAINCVGYCAYFPATGTTECLVIPFTDMFWHSWVGKFNNLPQPKIFQNGLYDNLYFMRWGVPVFNWLFDTQHLFHSWYSELPKRLDFITAFALRKVRYWKDDGKTGNIRDYYRYNAQDCWATLNSFLSIIRECDSFALTNYLEEFPLVFPCLTCELEGVANDPKAFAVVKALKEQEVIVKQKELDTMLATTGFNVNSAPQKKNLFKLLGVGHLPDTAKASMLKAQAAHPLNNRILGQLVEIVQARKLLSTYFVEEKLFHGRWHYKLNPAGTDTGRLASAESSYWCGLQIQNIPRGDSVKQCFVSDPGWLLCEIDKAQSEARCVGYLSGEQKLIDLVESQKDYHAWNAQAFFGVPYETIYSEEFKKTLNKELRDLSKKTNHGANYNMGANVMLDTMGPKMVAKAKAVLKLPASWSLKKVCEYLLQRYEETYPKVKGLFYDSIIREIELAGKLTSPLGWVRVFFSKPSRSNKPALNAAVAHKPQNLSVAIINREFYSVWREQIYGILKGKIRIKAQIHDSILFQYRKDCPEVPEIVCGMMQTAVTIKGADGITRVMRIPSDVAVGTVDKKTGQMNYATRWSELK